MFRMLRIIMIPVALSALLVASARAQGGRSMTLDDLLTAVRLTDPQLSPDGKTVLFTRTTTSMPTGKRNADIWTVPADGSAPAKPFIEGPKTESNARFLPDGKHVVFMSNRDGDTRVYLADLNGTIVRAITPRLPGRSAGATDSLSRRPESRVHLGRALRLPRDRSGLQGADTGCAGQRPGEGASAHAVAVPALG